MKTLVIATALVAFAVTSPALAQSTGSSHVYSDGSIATTNPNDVVFEGQIIGSDPDANIRFQLWREAQFLQGGAE
jgi:type 1 fimbria pilin